MILSIESSCDDSSIAITQINDCKLIFHKKISQDEEHSNYGGIVPEIASRLHAQRLPEILKEALDSIENQNLIKAVAITTEPGLSVTLIEGLMMAKALCISLKIPLISINHLKAHIYSLFIDNNKATFPLSILLVSGGHTQIIEARHIDKMEVVAQSMDDSFGESFDKVSKMLGFGYPGGPIIQNIALENKKITFPIPLKSSKEIGFSFSGLKNSVRMEIQKTEKLDEITKQMIAYSFQESATEHIAQKCRQYLDSKSEIPKKFAIVGGASANMALRKKIQDLCDSFGIELVLPKMEFCSDNAAMVGRIGVEKYINNDFCDLLKIDISPKSREL